MNEEFNRVVNRVRKERGLLRAADIPQFGRNGSYEVTVGWDCIEWHLERWLRDFRLDLDPEFQRGHVWTKRDQREYVEFVLRGGRSARTIYFNCPNWQGAQDEGQMVLVDGKQRLEAVRRFAANDLAIFGGVYLRDCEEDFLRDIAYNFQFNVNNLPTLSDVLRWYIEMNSTGKKHSKADLGKARSLLEAQIALGISQSRGEFRGDAEAER